MAEHWASRHFSLSNPRDDGSTDLPRLLRRLADRLEGLGIAPTELLDVTISQDTTEAGPWWTATVYWSSDDEASEDLDGTEESRWQRD